MSLTKSRHLRRAAGLALFVSSVAVLTFVSFGCQPKDAERADSGKAPVASAENDPTFGSQPTPFDFKRPIRGRIMSLKDARIMSLLPVVEPGFLPEGVALQQVRVDKGDSILAAERVYLLYAGNKSKRTLKQGRLWEGIKVWMDGGISIADVAELKRPLLISYELAPKRPGEMKSLPGDFARDDSGRSLSRLEWWSKPGISYRIFSDADKATIQKVAASIPVPTSAEGFAAYDGETVVTGKNMTMPEVGKDPLLRTLTPRRPTRTPTGATIKMLLAQYQPDDKIATLRLIYSSKALPKLAAKMQMSDGSEIAVANGYAIQSFNGDIKDGMLLTFRTENEVPADLGVPITIGMKSVYFLKGFVDGQATRKLPNEAHWHEAGQHISFYAKLPKEPLVQVAGSLPVSDPGNLPDSN